MTIGIQNLLSEINSKGLHSPNRFQIEIPRAGTGKDLQIFCETVSIPGIQISTFEYPLELKEHMIKVPNGLIYEDVTCSFMLTNDFKIKKFFDDWLKTIITDDYLLNYTSEYEQDITITALNQLDNAIYSIKLIQAYPVTVAPIDLSSSSQNEYTKLDVTFAFNRLEFVEDE